MRPIVHRDGAVWHLNTLGCYKSDLVPKMWLITVKPDSSFVEVMI